MESQAKAKEWKETVNSCRECDEEQHCDKHTSDIIRAKWGMDGAETLSMAAAKLRELATELEELEEDGWQLERPIEDDYGFIVPK